MVETHRSRSLVRDLPARTEFGDANASLTLLPELCLVRIRYRGEDGDEWLSGRLLMRAPMPCREELSGAVSCAWLGPGEWLLTGPEEDVKRLTSADSLEDDENGKVTDITHGSAAFRITGPDAVNLLAAHCPLDFSDTAMPVGFVARTLLAETRMIMFRRKDNGACRQFQLIVDQTMRDYAIRMLVGSAQA